MSAASNPTVEQDSTAAELKTAVKHSFIYGIGSMLGKAAGFLLLPLYTHYLSPQDYGVFEVLELSMSLLGMFLNMGVTSAILRFYSLAETEAQKRKVVGTLFLFTLGASVLVCLAGFSAVRPATRFLLGPGVPAIYLVLSFLGFLLAYIANVPNTALRAKGAASTVATLDVLSTTGMLLLNIILIVGLKTPLLGMFLSRIIINVFYIVVLARWTYRELLAGLDWKLLRQTIGFGAPLVLSNLSMFVLNFSDRFFLQHLKSLEVVGVYAVGYKFGYLLNAVIIWPFFMMWHARMYVIYQQADHEKLFARIFALYSSLLISVGLGMSVFSPEIMRFMVDSRYAPAVAVIPVIALSYVVLGIGYYVQAGMYLKSRTGLLGMVCAAASVLNLGANYVLITRIGMMGAAWATVGGFLVMAIGSYYCSQRVCPLPLPVGRVGKALCLGVGVYLLSAVLPAVPLAVDLLLKTLLIAGFPVLLWISGCFSSDDLTALNSLRLDTLRLLRPAWLRI